MRRFFSVPGRNIAGLALLALATLALSTTRAAPAPAQRAALTPGRAQTTSSRGATLAAELRDPTGRPLVAAHRGGLYAAPENSLAALELCVAAGIDIIEIDLRLTRDRRIVLLHDETLERTTDGHGRLADLDLDQVRTLRLRAGSGHYPPALTEQGIPTLEDFLRAAAGRILVILDIKVEVPFVTARAAELLQELGTGEQTLFALLGPADQVRPQAGPLLDVGAVYLPNLRPAQGPMSSTVRSYADLQPRAVAVRFDDWAYLEEGLGAARALGCRVWVNTLDSFHAGGLTDEDALLNPDALWGRLLASGVSMIQTDYPRELRAYLAGRQYRLLQREQ